MDLLNKLQLLHEWAMQFSFKDFIINFGYEQYQYIYISKNEFQFGRIGDVITNYEIGPEFGDAGIKAERIAQAIENEQMLNNKGE